MNLVKEGHEVLIEKGAGMGSAFTDEDYTKAGAILVSNAEEAWRADMVMKVKEPLPSEYVILQRRFNFIYIFTSCPRTRAYKKTSR